MQAYKSEMQAEDDTSESSGVFLCSPRASLLTSKMISELPKAIMMGWFVDTVVKDLGDASRTLQLIDN